MKSKSTKPVVVKILKTKKAAPGELTFEKICELEPEMKDLYQKALTLKRKKDAYDMLHRQIKPLLTLLVGENAKNPTLRTFNAYEVAVDTITKVLGI